MEVVQGTTYSLNGFTMQQLGDSRRQYSWERGQIDYLGIDSFDNILSQLDAKLHWTPWNKTYFGRAAAFALGFFTYANTAGLGHLAYRAGSGKQ